MSKQSGIFQKLLMGKNHVMVKVAVKRLAGNACLQTAL